MRRIAGILIVGLLFLIPPALADDGARQHRALLIGVDLFQSRESTYPSSANNVQDMYKAMANNAVPFAQIVIPETPVTSAQTLGDWIGSVFGEADGNDVSYLYISTPWRL